MQPYSMRPSRICTLPRRFCRTILHGTTVVTLHNSIDLPSDLSDPNSQKKPADVIGLAVGDQSGYTHLRLFAGPKQIDILKSIHATGADGKADGQSLEPLIQFGWLASSPSRFTLRCAS